MIARSSGSPISGATIVAGVAGSPVSHSLSPALHNAWIRHTSLDAVYIPFRPPADAFAAFAAGLRGGVIRGLNVTAPFKGEALAVADQVSERARAAGAANLLLFENDGAIRADNTDGLGLLYAFRNQAPGFLPSSAPVVILGAGGAARGAVAAFLGEGAPEIRIVNRDPARAMRLVEMFGASIKVVPASDLAAALEGAGAVINATPQGLGGGSPPALPFAFAPPQCVVMDMIYNPIRTAFLTEAASTGLRTVDGLGMLIGQAIPSFEALFGLSPPSIDIRGLALDQMRRTK
jgi:shikimate dehydrogenase